MITRDDREDNSAVLAGEHARYTSVAIALHWAIAALILFNLAVGFFMEGFAPPYKTFTVMLHISSGLTILALTVVRVGWRLYNRPPPHPAAVKAWERHLSRGVHFLIYAAMVLMPLTGWAIISARPPAGSPGAVAAAAKNPVPVRPAGTAATKPGKMKIWGLLPIPAITPLREIGREPDGLKAQNELHETFVEWHSVGAYFFLALLVLHVGGALKHQIVDRQAELERMGLTTRR